MLRILGLRDNHALPETKAPWISEKRLKEVRERAKVAQDAGRARKEADRRWQLAKDAGLTKPAA